MRNSMEKIAREIGEKGLASFSTPLWNPSNTNENLTVVLHNLGGCSMGKDRNNGVVNTFGQVYKGNGLTITETYDDFYVVDGGIVPSSIGVNSSLTISALAFRIAENLVGHSHLPIEEVPLGTKTLYFPK
jgi:choline dehydrogenase-like flavoprotein